MDNWQKESAIKKILPKDKQTFSRDAVEILLGLMYDLATKDERSAAAEREREDTHGPMFI